MKRQSKILLGAAMFLLGFTTAAQNQYSVVDLGDAFEGYSLPYGINASGQVVGAFQLPGLCCSQHAFLFDGKQRHDLTPDFERGYNSAAYAINDAGDIAGVASQEGGHGEPGRGVAVRWRAGQILSLGYLGGVDSVAHAINNQGQIAGSSTIGPDRQLTHPFLWEEGAMEDLDPSVTGQGGAWAMNDSGAVAGEHPPRGVLWEQGKRQELFLGIVRGMNNAGQVVGGSDRPLLWDPVDGTRELGSLGRFPYGYALAINNLGQVVGWSQIEDDIHAFIWQDGAMTDLNLLIPADSG